MRDPRGSCSNTFVYIADVTGYGLVVYDFAMDKTWRVENKLLYPFPPEGTFKIQGYLIYLFLGCASGMYACRIHFNLILVSIKIVYTIFN